jgi:hypothetical protein
VVLEAQPPHALGLPEVPSVKDHRPAEEAAQAIQVEELELVPLRDEHDGISAVGRIVWGLA